MTLARSLWQIHRWTGMVVGVFFAIVALTGIVLIWSHELNLRGHQPLAPSATNTVNPALTGAIANFVAAHPGSRLVATVVPRAAEPPRAWNVFLRPAGASTSIVAEFDPEHATLLGVHGADDTWQHRILDLHYEFFLGKTGFIICWIVSVAFLVLSVSGIWIYWPTLGRLFRWAPEGRISRKIGWLHKWLGAWALLLALIWGITGFLYLWIIAPGRFDSPSTEAVATNPDLIRRVHDLPELISNARTVFPDAAITSIGFSENSEGSTTVTLRTFHRGRWFWEKTGLIILNAATGKIINVREPGAGSGREKLLGIMASLHFGSQGSRLQQVLWSLGGLVMLFLPVSGYALCLSRIPNGNRKIPPAVSLSGAPSAGPLFSNRHKP